MNGMQLSKAYFEKYGRDLLNKFPDYIENVAVGLVGEGSECYGYDDAISVDHDYGPGFCIWLPQAIYDVVGKAMQEEYESLPKEYLGYKRIETPEGAGRVGVFSIESFYEKYTGCRPVPTDNREWFLIPERFLSVATNGDVFFDPRGDFSRARNILKGYYPRDVLLKKLAARMSVMAQAGQYNYMRSTSRDDYRAAYLCCSNFVDAALSAIYLLNGQYMPFYKWAFRGTSTLELLRDSIKDLDMLVSLADSPKTAERKQQLIESISIAVGKELNRRNFSSIMDAFLLPHCAEIMSRISDNRLQSLHVMADNN